MCFTAYLEGEESQMFQRKGIIKYMFQNREVYFSLEFWYNLIDAYSVEKMIESTSSLQKIESLYSKEFKLRTLTP